MSAGDRRPTVWVVSELYFPELTSTGHYMTMIAERLAADGYRVEVLCGQPTYGAHGTRGPKRERRRGVNIRRCGATTFHKDNLAGRVVNMLTLSVSTTWAALRGVREGDVVIAVTTPPTTPLIAALVAAVRRATFVPVFHDVLPVILEVVGRRSPTAWSSRLARWMTGVVVRRAHTVVAVGRPLVAELERYGGAGDIVVIPTWADDRDVAPVAGHDSSIRRTLGLVGAKVALYAGTFGRANDLDTLLAAAAELERRSDIVFVLCGDGPRRGRVERWIADRHVTNVVVTGPYPRARQSDMYGAGDIVVIPMRPGTGRSSMPSRAYNALAAGRPIVAGVEFESELAMLVDEHRVGRVVAPADAVALAGAVESLLDDPHLGEIGRRARSVASGPCSANVALAAWSALVAGLVGRSDHPDRT